MRIAFTSTQTLLQGELVLQFVSKTVIRKGLIVSSTSLLEEKGGKGNDNDSISDWGQHGRSAFSKMPRSLVTYVPGPFCSSYAVK